MIESITTLMTVFCFVLVPCSALLSYFSRKAGADLQARVGPNRAGPAGLFQPVADLLKALQKEDAASSTPLFQQLALALVAAVLLSTVTIIPFSGSLLLLDADMSVFLTLWAALSAAMVLLFIGFHRGTVPAWISALRVSFQSVTATFPALIAILCVGITAGGFRWENILAVQGASPLSWIVFSNPFAPFAFVVFVVSGLILFSTPPMDAGLSRMEIQGGLSSLWGGRNLSLFNFIRFYGFFLWACMATGLFLGGGRLPDGVQDSLGPQGVTFFQVLIFLFKAFTLMLVIDGVTRANPRTRADQITGFSWRVLSPIALASLVGTALWRVFV